MKAITLWQPWASLLACGAKKYETRSWATKYRGPIAIHAAKRPYSLADIDFGLIRGFEDAVESVFGKMDANCLPLGEVIATAELVGCYEIFADTFCKTRIIFSENGLESFGHDEISESDNEFLFGDWTPGRYAWEFANMTMLSAPIPARGKQRLWDWEAQP